MPEKTFWTPDEVYNYLKNLNPSEDTRLPNNAYCTEHFTWNEVLKLDRGDKTRPSRQILENLKSTADVLQNYRYEIGSPIFITSGLRTNEKQKLLIQQGYKPSSTSLHKEGLAFDFVVPNKNLSEVQKYLDNVHVGEVEFGHNYSHISLPSFSKDYLKGNGFDINKTYRTIGIKNPQDLSLYRSGRRIIKRFTDINPNILIPDNFDIEKHNKAFKNAKVNLADYKYDDVFKSDIDERVFTIEEVEEMPNYEYEKFHNAVMKQISSFGLPTIEQAQRAVIAGELIWVNSYYRDDGTPVHGYYRRRRADD